MKRFVAVSTAVLLSLALAGAAMAYQLTHENQWVTLDGTQYNHKNGIRLGNLLVEFDDTGLTLLNFRVTALRGTVTLKDMHVMAGDRVVYKLSDQEKLDIEFHFFESVTKHFEKRLTFDKPLSGFGLENGSIRWYFRVGTTDYQVTWTTKGNNLAWEEIGRSS
ncbi:MAG: hypothetical protein M5R36_21775 [Deltaproteobacteria bacterium]|nr:hypothetical protein [Deltaproteobacteria bacterium]